MRPACIRCCWPSAASATRRIAERRRPQELLTTANAILGQGQLSLAKYLWIAAGEDDPELDVHDVPAFFRHVLERVDWRRDLHFQTCTTIDTLDYSGGAMNEGSKLVIAAAGPPVRELPTRRRQSLRLPDGFRTGRGCACRACWSSAGPPYRAGRRRRRRGDRAVLRSALRPRRSDQSAFRWSWWSTTRSSRPARWTTSSG